MSFYSVISLWGPVAGWAGLIFLISSIAQYDLPGAPDFASTAAHVIEYGILGFLIKRGIHGTYNEPGSIREERLYFIAALTACCLYALSDEVHQLFVPGRHFQVSDLIADSAGGVIGIVLYSRIAVVKSG